MAGRLPDPPGPHLPPGNAGFRLAGSENRRAGTGEQRKLQFPVGLEGAGPRTRGPEAGNEALLWLLGKENGSARVATWTGQAL